MSNRIKVNPGKFPNFPQILIKLVISLIFLVTIPIILLFSSPIFLFRYVTGKLAPFLRPDLGKLLTARGTIFATDDIHGTPKCNIVASITVPGNFDIQATRELCQRNLIDAVLPDGSLEYPELTQYVTKWMGFFFFKSDPAFEISDHIKLYDEGHTNTSKSCDKNKDNPNSKSKISDKQLAELRQSLVAEPWLREKSAWDVTIVHGCYPDGCSEDEGPYSTIFIRFHHHIGDGISVLFLCIHGLCEKSLDTAIPSLPTRSLISKFLFFSTFPFRSAYELATLYMTARKEIQEGPWRVRESLKNHKCNVDLMPKLHVDVIRAIKSHFKVSFTSVIFSIIASACREIMIRKGMKVPETMPCLLPLPVPNHSTKLRNEMTGAMAHLPLGDMSPESRLQACFEEYERLKRSTMPLLNIFTGKILGSYFPHTVRKYGVNVYATTGMTNVPGQFGKLEVNGSQIVDISVCTGLQLGIAGIGFAVVSYANELRISTVANAKALSKAELGEIMKEMEKHIDILQKLICSDI